MKYIFIYIFYFLFFLNTIQAADSTAIAFATALENQNKGKHSEAIQGYEKLLSKEITSAAVCNNLGLAYIQNGELGKGIVQFERALKIDASNQDALHNLQAAQQRIEENFTAPKALFFVRWWNGIAQAFTSTSWAVFFLLLMTIGAGGIALWRKNQDNRFRLSAVSVLAFSIFPLIWGFQQKSIETDDSQAIVIKKQIGLRESPDLASKEVELLFEGNKVEIMAVQDSWVHVKLPNSLIGWVPGQMLERI